MARTATDAERVIASLVERNWQTVTELTRNLALPYSRVLDALGRVEAITYRDHEDDVTVYGFETRRAIREALV